MIVYSVSIKIDLDVHDEWLTWMKNEHIPEVMATQKFNSYKMLRILAQDETEGINYNVQYSALSMKDYFDYLHEHSEKLQEKHLSKFHEKFVAFRTLLKEVS